LSGVREADDRNDWIARQKSDLTERKSNGKKEHARHFGENIRRMRERKLSFEEAIRTVPGLNILDKIAPPRASQVL
jgi:hypothetical protein